MVESGMCQSHKAYDIKQEQTRDEGQLVVKVTNGLSFLKLRELVLICNSIKLSHWSVEAGLVCCVQK